MNVFDMFKLFAVLAIGERYLRMRIESMRRLYELARGL